MYVLPDLVVVESALTNPDRIVQACLAMSRPQSEVGSGGVARDIRDARSIRLPYDKGIGATMAGIGMAANRKHWRFDITHADQCEFLCYEKEGHYVGHVDTFMQRDGDCRKLTVLAILNDEFEGGRFWIKGSGDDRVYPVQTKGSVIVFPSFMLHGVEPVTLGPRYSLVTWLVGPWFR